MKCSSDQQTHAQMQQWARQMPGEWFQAEEQEQLDNILPTLFGYHLLQVGDLQAGNCLGSSRISHHMVLDSQFQQQEEDASGGPNRILGSPQSLPVATDSLDVVVLPHTLDFSRDPYQVLREADRILIPEGHMVILGFNPWSPWFIWRLVLGWRGNPPWCGRFIRQNRLKDWLQLLGYEMIHSGYYFFRPPLRQQGIMSRLGFLERLGKRWWPIFGAGYILVARKCVSTLTPIRPRWRAARRRLSPAELIGNSRSMDN